MKVSTFKNFLALDMNLALNYFELDHLNDLIKPTYHKDICFSELKMDFNSEKDIEFSNHFTLDFEQFLETSFKLFDKVSHKNQMIAFARYSDLTAITSLQQVGLEFGVTRERIRQIIKKVQSSWQYHFSAGYISVYYKFIEIHCAPTDELCLDSEIWDKYQDKLGLLRLLFDKSLYFNQLSKSISIISNEEKQQRLKQLVTKISNVIIQNFKELGPIKNIHDIRLQALSTSQKNDLFVYIEHTYYPSANHFDKSFCLRYYLLSNYPDGFQLPSDVENIKRLYDNIYGEAELTDRAFTGRVLHQALTIYHIWARGTYIDDIYLPQFEVCDLSILVTSIEKELQKLSQFGINTLYEKHDDILHKYNIINQYQFYSILRKSINGTSFELPKFPTIVKKGTSKKLITNEILDYVLENGPILKKSVYTEFIENRGYVATTVQMFLGSCVDIVNVSKHQITHMDNCIISEYCEEKLNAILTESLSSKKEVEVADLYQANIASLAGLHIANEYQLASYIKYFCPAYEITGTRVSKEKVKSYKEIYLSFCNQLTMPISKTKFQAYFRDLGWGKRQLTGYRATNKNLISLDQYYLPKAIVNITDNNLLQLERYIDYQLTLYDYLPIYHIVTFMKDSSITLKNNLDVYPAVVAYLIQTHIPRLTLLTSSTHKVMAITKDKSFNFLTILVSFLIDENINLNDNDEVSSFLLKFGYIHTQLSYPQHEKVILAQNNYQCFQHPIKQLNIHLDIERALNIDDDEETLDDEIDFNEYFSI